MNEVEVIPLFKRYTHMARELCHCMYQLIPEDKRPLVSQHQNSTHFEWLFDLIYDLEPSEEFVIYLDMQWEWYVHGEHCLFESEQGTQIEANIYNTDVVDIAFFNAFIKSYDGAQSLLASTDHIDFNSTATLFDQLAQQHIFIQHNGTTFSLATPLSS